MNRMPSEIKHLIARSVRDKSRRSLCALSLVDRGWNTIARPLLYEHIIIRVLEDGVYHSLLWQPDAERVLNHIKRLSIVGTYHAARHSSITPVSPKYTGLRTTLEDQNLGDRAIPRFGVCPNGQWAEVIDLLRKIPALRDIDLLIGRGGSAELHEAIAQYHPTCQLSVYFNPQFADKYRRLDDWTLSPQLHTAHVTFYEYPGRKTFSEHPDRVLENVVVRAPHAKVLVLQIAAGGQAGPRPNFNETVIVERKTEMEPLRAKLEQLSWPLNTRMPVQQFLKWDQLVDYSCLRSWTVGCIEDAQVLWSIADLRPFQQLNRLTLALYPPQEGELSFYTAAEAMFDSLPQLRYLCLLGTYRPALLTTAVRKHGSTLLELKLSIGPSSWNHQFHRRLLQRGQTGPIFRAEEIHALAAHCPSLQALQIAIQRNRGLETAAYTALAHFPQLTTLDLRLSCRPLVGPNEPPAPIPPRDLTDFERAQTPPSTNIDVPIWYLRDAMINSAIDRDLAKAIFAHIRAHQIGRRQLTKLQIRPLYDIHERTAARASRAFEGPIFKALASSWTVTTDLVAGVRAVEHARGHYDHHHWLRFSRQLQCQSEVIFNSIWPPVDGEEGDDAWLQRWHSWPLQPA